MSGIGVAPTMNFKRITVALTGSPVQISATKLQVSEFELHNPTGNAVVYIGPSTVDATWIPRAAGTTTDFSVLDAKGLAKAFDLSQLYILGTAAQSCIVQYRVKD